MILVTGATGHTGQRMAEALAKAGNSVRILTRDPAKVPPRLQGKVDVAVGSLHDPQSCVSAFQGVQSVICCTHIKFANSIITLCEIAGVQRAIFLSSTRRFTKFPEETARQVAGGEASVRCSQLRWTILRCSMIYGGEEDNNITHLVASLRRWPAHPLPAGGGMKWQPVFTWDVIAAAQDALANPRSIKKEYTLAGPDPLTYREIVETICHELKVRRFLFPIPLWILYAGAWVLELISKRPRITVDAIRRLEEDKVFDIHEPKRDLDFRPVSFREGIRRKLSGTA